MTQISIFKSDSGAYPAVDISNNMVTVGSTPTESLATYLEGLSSDISGNNSSLITLINNETSRAESAESNITTALNQEIARAKSAESNLEPKLGFTPVQQGTGVGQSTNAVKIGWDGSANLKATVDTTDLGDFAFQSWVSNNFASKASNTLAGLTDVSLSTLSNYQFLTYSSTSSKWINQSFPLSTDSDNLAQWDSTGLLVKLAAAADVSNQYIANAGSDTTGDGTKNNPFATIRHALNRIPDNTSANIWLKSGDTFSIEDTAPGYVENGTLSQVNFGSFDLKSRRITFLQFGNSSFETAYTSSGISLGDVEIGPQPIIKFTTSKTSDTGEWVTPGFTVSNFLQMYQVTIQMSTDNVSSVTSPVISEWNAAFVPVSGTISLLACNFILSNITPFAGEGSQASSTTVVLYSPRFDVTNGTAMIAGQMGVTLKAPFTDVSTTIPYQINGTNTQWNYRISNFNSAVAKLANYPGLTVIDSTSRTYSGITTQNKLDNT